MIKINDNKYRCLIPQEDVLNIDLSFFDPRYCFEVVYLIKKTGELKVSIWGHQSTPKSAMLEAMAYCDRDEVEILDAYPVVELIEDRECLVKRLKYQLSRRNDLRGTKAVKYPHSARAYRQAPLDTIKKLRALEAA